jgi:cation transport ATPase
MTSFIEMAATIMTFHLLRRYLETRTKGRATAQVEREGREVEIPVAVLAVGDVMVVRPGAKVPTDGEIVEGTSHPDESSATGESAPVEKGPGDAVIGATINTEGLLKVHVALDGVDTVRVGSRRLLEETGIDPAPLEDRLRALETEGKTARCWSQDRAEPVLGLVLQPRRHPDRRARPPSRRSAIRCCSARWTDGGRRRKAPGTRRKTDTC